MNFPGEDWVESAPESQGIDAVRLEKAMLFLAEHCGIHKADQAVVIRNGHLVYVSRGAAKALRASLGRLQTDYIDLYMVHWPVHPHSIEHFTADQTVIANPLQLEEAFEALSRLKEEGKVRHIGVSNHGVAQLKEVQRTGAAIAANELAYNLFSRAIEESIIPYCRQSEIGVIGYMPLLQGLLTGKCDRMEDVKPMQARSRHFHYSRGMGSRHQEEGAEAEIMKALAEIREISSELGIAVSELALAWAAANEAVTTTIVGSRNSEQLLANIRGAELKLERDLYERLNEITEPVLLKLGSNPDYYENRENSRIV